MPLEPAHELGGIGQHAIDRRQRVRSDGSQSPLHLDQGPRESRVEVGDQRAHPLDLTVHLGDQRGQRAVQVGEQHRHGGVEVGDERTDAADLGVEVGEGDREGRTEVARDDDLSESPGPVEPRRQVRREEQIAQPPGFGERFADLRDQQRPPADEVARDLGAQETAFVIGSDRVVAGAVGYLRPPQVAGVFVPQMCLLHLCLL